MPLLKCNFLWCLKKDNVYHDGSLVYAQAKRGMIEMTDMMAKEAGPDVIVTSVHPGWCRTPGLKPLFEQHSSYESLNFRPAIEGAYGIAYSLIQPDLKTAEFYLDGDLQPKHKAMARTEVD
jgi:NAD(P)-dependent dehydrogenase (short-subunit alcohol dehydrogenase family)